MRQEHSPLGCQHAHPIDELPHAARPIRGPGPVSHQDHGWAAVTAPGTTASGTVVGMPSTRRALRVGGGATVASVADDGPDDGNAQAAAPPCAGCPIGRHDLDALGEGTQARDVCQTPTPPLRGWSLGRRLTNQAARLARRPPTSAPTRRSWSPPSPVDEEAEARRSGDEELEVSTGTDRARRHLARRHQGRGRDRANRRLRWRRRNRQKAGKAQGLLAVQGRPSVGHRRTHRKSG